jgi:hypothetical protein
VATRAGASGSAVAGGVEQSADVIARRRNLIIGRSSADADFGNAQAGEAVESFLHRQVVVRCLTLPASR